MPKFNYRTKNNSSPSNKRRIYFTCHPEDFELYFDNICEDIFKTQNCVIYYTEDMSEPFEEDELDTDIGSNNLVVVPVTLKLLTQQNRAMDNDILYAKAHHIPILPFMMESGIDIYYSSPEKFGELQYLCPFSNDSTAIRYEDKLKRYLENILISDETVKQIRAAFDAYIFLSYRKKDRKYANELMRLIHADPRFRDIAIWYDEFLTPGESFKENIDRILADSKLMTLLVTPNILEEPNFVMSEEYPAAKRANKIVLPAEMELTDRSALEAKYSGISGLLDPKDTYFTEQLAIALERIAKRENDDDPIHNYLLGLAYLDGIDVEVNIDYGVKYITMAAERNFIDAIIKIMNMYGEGEYVQKNLREKVKWANKAIDFYAKSDMREEEEGMRFVLASTYYDLSEYEESVNAYKTFTDDPLFVKDDQMKPIFWLLVAQSNYFSGREKQAMTIYKQAKMFFDKSGKDENVLVLLEDTKIDKKNCQEMADRYKKLYEMSCELYGELNTYTTNYLEKYAFYLNQLGEIQKATEFYDKAHLIRCNILGDEKAVARASLDIIANQYREIEDHENAAQSYELLYLMYCDALGDEHDDAKETLEWLAIECRRSNNYQKAIKYYEKLYSIYCKTLGEKKHDTLNNLYWIAYSYANLGEHKRSAVLYEKVYTLQCEVLGEKNSETLSSLSELAYEYRQLNEYEKSVGCYEKLYAARCKALGEEHPDTLSALHNLAYNYGKLGDHKKSTDLYEKTYMLRCNILGKEDPSTLLSLDNLAYEYRQLKECEKSFKCYENLYTTRCKVLGEEHPDTLGTLHNLAYDCSDCGDHKRAVELSEKVYTLRCRVLGEEATPTLASLNNLAYEYGAIGEQKKSTELYERLYSIRCRILGEENIKTIMSMHSLAKQYKSLGEKEKALMLFEKIYVYYCGELGSNPEKAEKVLKEINELKRN